MAWPSRALEPMDPVGTTRGVAPSTRCGDQLVSCRGCPGLGRIPDWRAQFGRTTDCVNLGGLPPYERGDHVWFKTLVENPTQWNGEGRGNDFPALSYYDPYLRAQFRMFFDMTAMSWMGEETIARFYSYSCGFRRLYDGSRRQRSVFSPRRRAAMTSLPVRRSSRGTSRLNTSTRNHSAQ